MKRRLLLVQKLLYENTDEQHPLNTFEILDYLQDQGILTNRKTLKGDIDLMVACGLDIVTVQSKPNRYFWGVRNFEQAELKLLIGSVSTYPEVALSPNFYSWVFKFAGDIRILSPAKAVKELFAMAQGVLDTF